MKIDFQAWRVTSEGGLIVVREWDERLGLGDLIAQHLTDRHRGKNTQFPFADLLRQAVSSRLGGYEDVHDAEYLSQDRTIRLIGSKKASRARRDRQGGIVELIDIYGNERIALEAREGRLPAYDAEGKLLGPAATRPARPGWLEFQTVGGARSYVLTPGN